MYTHLNEILTNPVGAILRAKREKNFNKTLQVLIFNWFLISVAALAYPGTAAVKISVALGVGLIGIVATLFFGMLIQIVFTILGGKGKFFEGVTSATYAILPIAVGTIASYLVSLLPGIGIPLALFISIVFSVLGVVIFYRSVKELFSIDIISAWAGVGILTIGVFLGVYLGILPMVGGVFSSEPFMYSPIMGGPMMGR